MTTKYRLGNTILIGSGHILYSIGKNCEDGDYYLFVTHRLRHRGFVYTTVQVYTASTDGLYSEDRGCTECTHVLW